MRKFAGPIFIIVFPALLILPDLVFAGQKNSAVKSLALVKKPAPSFLNSHSAEKIVYTVKLGKASLGKAVFHNVSRSQLDGRAVDFITFETKLANFYDLEKIYSDAESFLPVKIERQVNNFTSREKITESYDQKKFILTITKFKGKKEKQTVIKKDNVIHNAILLPYYVRRMPKLDLGLILTAQLPNQKFKIRLASIEKVSVPAGKFNSYHFVSEPKKFEIWITADKRRIPVKIKGIGGAIGYTMLMREITGS